MNLEEIKDLIKLVSKSGLGKVEIEREGFRISIKGSQTEPIMYQAAPVATAPVAAAPVVTNVAPTTSENNENSNENSKYITVKSPMIGTFYRTPGPDKDAFVNIGDTIQKGDKVCIIEAMKTFNEIEAEISGKIIKVLVDNASPVDYDQPLFLVDPA
jgi:acetyl-CoA carboxylase biotin carboxyl carrier protein